ncbi:hypothetical protein [Crocosphaera chwakensis]|uniref:Uncharacterized protein n=1 Tax=Crocosphaera chwakensis CCY0110 TaxID=391612 RepID=A3IR11_9CHRO|nr:hypothetical protein [Crocosphaera chwakensis]EAZ91001.1 hypothetical protein CY0110_27355 [Crocosphaera chwakensis CCY0110]
MRKIQLLSILIILLLIILIKQINPVSASVENRLRGDINRLRARVSRLESAITNLRQDSNNNYNIPDYNPSPQIVDGELVGRSDPLFERLSTLVIELKERVMDLEKRMNQLEK